VAGAFLFNFVRFLLLAIELLVLGRVLVSFVDPRGSNAISAFIIQTSEPILGPIRKLLPKSGMFDFSPLIVILVIGVILRAIPG
jgi:YggT family protein